MDNYYPLTYELIIVLFLYIVNNDFPLVFIIFYIISYNIIKILKCTTFLKDIHYSLSLLDRDIIFNTPCYLFLSSSIKQTHFVL